MSKFNRDKVMRRYSAIAVMLSLVCIAVIVKAGYIMTVDRTYWTTAAKGQQKEFDTIPAKRGNILSCDGDLLAASIPEYDVYIDFRPTLWKGHEEDPVSVHKRDSVWKLKLDSLCDGLHEIFPDESAESFKKKLEKGYQDRSRSCYIRRNFVDYPTFCRMEKLPFLNEARTISGFVHKPVPSRRHPFGSLADRTIGSRGYINRYDTNYNAKKYIYHARYGLEQAYDSVLRGQDGITRREKIRRTIVNNVVSEAVNGCDIVTTIDVGMQDIAERALREELILRDALMGVAILLEVQTGDVKAIVNLTREGEGVYRERYNDAISYLTEPGSVFKVASMLAAFNDGVDTAEIANVGNGTAVVHGHILKDSSAKCRGNISAAKCLEESSNIGVSQIVERHYTQRYGVEEGKRKFAQHLHDVGIAEDLKLDIKGYKPPYIRFPDQDKNYPWFATTMAWMSFGYETQVAPINTVAFYNAIANKGKMMRPRFVKQILRDGQVVQDCPPVVLREQIAKPEVIEKMRVILQNVVGRGTGRPANPHTFLVAGKTGTAQVSGKDISYHGKTRQHWLSFCGFFPADNPRYTCIVCVKSHTGGGGGVVSGTVFRKIAEGVVARNLRKNYKLEPDTLFAAFPIVKNGNKRAADYVLSQLDLGSADMPDLSAAEGTMPNVIGMGASDAIYALERLGIKVSLDGTGEVVSQSIPAGRALVENMSCELHLQ